MNELQEQGRTTSAIRNRTCRRAYNSQRQSDNLSSLFTWCGADFVLTDFTQSDYDVRREDENKVYQDKKNAKLAREAQLCSEFGKIVRKKKQKEANLDEAYEVVE